MPKAHILIVDDEPDIRQLMQEILQDEGYQVASCQSGAEAMDYVKSHSPDLVFLDIWMPDIDGISVLQKWSQDKRLPFQVVMISGHGTIETAVEATRLGAYDFIEKPVGLAKLLLTAERALERHELHRENQSLKQQLKNEVFLIGNSPATSNLRDQATNLASHETPLLILGETGTGKQNLARYIHQYSKRADSPFIVMNMDTIANENVPVELFGHEQNGNIYKGKLEQASGGFLFLDELTRLAPDNQRKLVSALESRQFLRVGGNSPVNIDVRVVASSSEDMQEQLSEGKLLPELYYLVSVVPLELTPLRDRKEDVPELLNHFTEVLTSRDNMPYRHFSIAAQNKLKNHGWPGNIREMLNLVKRLLLTGEGEEISADEVTAVLSGQAEHKPATNDMALDLPMREAREMFEKEYLTRQLQRAEGSVGTLAKITGLERTHLYRKLRALGIDPKQV